MPERVDRKIFRTRATGLIYWGGKYNAMPLLLQYFPSKTGRLIFVDVFAGSGVVSLNYANKLTIMNDKYDLIYNFLYVLSGVTFKKMLDRNPSSKRVDDWRDRYNLYLEFEDEVRTTNRGPSWSDEYATRDDPVGKAIYYYILNRNNFSGIIHTNRPQPFDYKVPGNVPWIHYNYLLRFFQSCDVRIWNLDFRNVLTKAKKTWNDTERQRFFFYCDPPYPKEGEGYTHKFTERDSRDLARLLMNSKHHWMCSNEDSEFIRDIYDGAYLEEVQWQYSGAKRAATQGRSELLISNKPLKREMIKGSAGLSGFGGGSK